MPTPDRSDATRSARAALHEWVAAIPTRDGADDAGARDARTWVAALALEGTWLGLYQDAYELTESEWDAVIEDLSRYADVRPPASAVVFRDVDLDADPFRDDERPLVDAVLRVALEEGVHNVTLAAVARRCDRSESTLLAMFGDAETLVDDVALEVLQSGFDDLSPLRLDPSRAAVAASVAALDDSRKAAALLRLYALGGVARDDVPEGQHAVHELVLRAWRDEGAPTSLVVAALACDGWRAGELQRALVFPSALPGAVVRELARLVDDAAGPGPAGPSMVDPG
ncbi:helix-turn-helix transcriptional regulator [Cellulosimicrobium composti]|uniref:Helix-turn-helix transcriptional regulator n=1 Tax=Cellulosimicrobium composti TaxID=2672572 RepID=A0ABX0BBT0_9MICO|nr:helix-turn-helix transcriptional regulator [Cellulosimicrobium composti]NDO90015.1 helix-turn-helix transcriptional regulator [Cellulosimicrobium composti]TWG79571.1 TetR family transcriptional regulator [Cellulosimicrobium cellulans J34]SMF36935.1 transcriptional regulator, TetR family [Cellulosimicrobium cellulans J1]